MKISKTSNTNFKSGLTQKILEREKNINAKDVERFFKQLETKDFRSFNNTDFKDNKTVALGNRLCADIFVKLRGLYDYREGRSAQELTSPTDIYVFNEGDSRYYKDGGFFVNTHSVRPEKHKPAFDIGTVFINNCFNSLEKIDEKMELLLKDKQLATSHFLSPFIHEWIHSIQDKLIANIAFNKNYSFECTIQNYNNQELTKKEKELASEFVGTYAPNCEYNQYAEVFADAWAKFICDSLSEDCTSFIKNPVDLYKNCPKEFRDLLKKVSEFKMVGRFSNNY